MDRMEKCVGYINAHTMIPNSEEEFLLLMMYGSMIVDAVKLVLHLLEVEHPYTRDSQTTYSYFADVCEEHNLILPDGKYQLTIKYGSIFALCLLRIHSKQAVRNF